MTFGIYRGRKGIKSYYHDRGTHNYDLTSVLFIPKVQFAYFVSLVWLVVVFNKRPGVAGAVLQTPSYLIR